MTDRPPNVGLIQIPVPNRIDCQLIADGTQARGQDIRLSVGLTVCVEQIFTPLQRERLALCVR